jgi:hypothetical protein
MKREEYETELKVLYRLAIKGSNISLALEILNIGKAIGLEDMNEKEKENAV